MQLFNDDGLTRKTIFKNKQKNQSRRMFSNQHFLCVVFFKGFIVFSLLLVWGQ